MAKKVNARDTKLNSESESKKDRRMEDRHVTESRVLSDQERIDEFRQTFFQSALPDLPKIPGYHVCWLTTENPRDPIHGRIRLGYEPIIASDIPGWKHASLRTGEWEGCIGVNEMVAFKLPLHLYEAYMREAHHNQPLAEEEKLNRAREEAEMTASQMARKPISFELEEGQAGLGDAPEPPSFERTLSREGVAPVD
ncbi:hypothetical protein [[Eubacterium] cellulosolvens]